jgi:peptide/nickel transport system substrate-binding protein
MKRYIMILVVMVLMASVLLGSCGGSKSTTTTTIPTTTKPATTTTAATTNPTTTSTTTVATPTAKPTVSPVYGGTLRQLATGSLTNLGYSITIPGNMTSFVYGCLEGYVRHNGRLGTYEPWLFVSWEQDPAEKYIIFHLREGVKYHDGTDFNAQAVKDYIELHQKVTPGWLANVTSTEIVNQYTVKLNTSYFDVIMWAQLNEQTASPTQLAKGSEACFYNPVGTGPFKYVEYKRDQYLKYERFDDYWGGKPYLDGFTLIFKSDTTAQLAALLAGEGDHIRSVQLKDIEMLKSKGYQMYDFDMVEGGLLPSTNNPNSVFANVDVRAAIEYAIDKETIAKTLGYGYMAPYDTIYPSPVPGYKAGIGRKYNPDIARQLLEKANLSGGFETTMYVSQFAIMDVMVAVQGYLAEVGIVTHIKEVDMGTWNSMRSKGWDGLLYQHGIFHAPYEYNLNRAYGPAYKDYVSAVRPAGFNDLLAKLLKTTDAKARLPLAEQMQLMVRDNVMLIPLVTWAQVDAINPKIHDMGLYRIHGTQCWDPEKTWLSK